MAWQFPPLLIIALFMAMVSLVMTVVAWTRSDIRGNRFLALWLLINTAWLVSELCELFTVSPAGKIFWLQAQYVALAIIPTASLIFILAFTERLDWLKRPLFWLAFLIPLIGIVLIYTNASHQLIWTSTKPVTLGSFTFAEATYGPWAWFHLVFSLGVAATDMTLIHQYAPHTPKGLRYQSLVLLFDVGLVAIAVLADLISPPAIRAVKFTPLAIILAATILIIAAAIHRIRDILPLARDAVFENMSDGVIILNRHHRVVDINQSACDILGKTTEQIIGAPIESLYPGWPITPTIPHNQSEFTKEMQFTRDEGVRTYDLRISTIKNEQGHVSGRLAVLRDITRQKQAEDALRRRDQILQAVSFAAEQFLKSATWEEGINDILARFGQATKVSRVYLFAITIDEERVFDRLRYTWADEGTQPLTQREDATKKDMAAGGYERWMKSMNRGQPVYGRVRDFPASEQEILNNERVLSMAAMPIFVAQEWWGYLGFDDCHTEREWSSVELDALRAAASTIGAAIQRQQSEEEIRRWNYFIITLLEVSEMIGSTLDVSEVLDQIALAVRNLLPLDHVAVFLWDDEEQALLPTLPTPSSGLRLALKDAQLEAYKKLRLSPANFPLIRKLLEENAVVAISDVTDNPLLPEGMAKLFGTKSLLAVPIIYQERFTGALYLQSIHQKHDFTKQEINLANALARQAGLAIERSRLYTQSKNDAAELAALYRSSAQLLNPGSDLNSLAKHITETVVHEFASSVCSIRMLDQETQTLRLSAQTGFPSGDLDEIPVEGPGIVTVAVRSGEMIYVPDVSKDARYVEVAPSTRSELDFPLRVGETIIGVLNIESSELDGYDERARRILAAYADNAALALQNVRLFNAANIHARQLSQLNEITRTAIGSTSFRETLKKLADQLVAIIDADECFINLWDENLQVVLPGAARGGIDAIYQQITAKPGEASLTQAVLQSGEPIYIPDMLNSEFTRNRITENFESKSALALPMILGDQKLGSVVFGFHEPRQLSKREISLCEQFSDQVGLSISKAWALEVAHQRAQEADNLRQATSAISSSLDLSQVLDSVLIHLEPVVPYDSACIYLLEGEYLRAVACRGFADPSQVIDQRYELDELFLQTQNLNQPTILFDAKKDPRFKGWGCTGYVRGWMGVPLRGRGAIIGILTLDSRQPGAFNEHSATLVQAFAGQAAVGIENSRLFEAARQRAREAETLRQAGAIVAATLKQDAAISNILEQLARVVPYASASVQLLNEGYLEIVGGVGWPGGVEKIIGWRFGIPGDNPNSIVIQHRQPYILGDAQAAYEGFKVMPHIVSWMGVPLIFGERILGMITMDSTELNYFTLDHARLASAFADQVAIAIENARLYAAEQNRVKHLDALRATAADLSAELDISRLLETILRRAVSLSNASGGELGLHHQQTGDLEIVASYNMGTDYTGMLLKMGEGGMGRAAETLKPQVVDDYKNWEGRSKQYQDISWKAMMAAPLMVHGRLVGAIGIVDQNTERKFSSSDLGLLTMFAQQAAIAVENARLYKDAKMAAEKRSILHRVSQEIVTASFDPEQIYTAIHRAATQMMPVDAFIITLVDDETDEIEAVYLIDRGERSPAMRSPRTEGLSGKVISSGQSVYYDDFTTGQTWNGVHFGSAAHTRSILAVPLRSGDHVIGMISAQSYDPHAYSTEDQILLEMLAAHAAIAIENTRLIKQIQWLAITDPLTGLFNRRGLFDLGQREVERYRRFGRPFAAIMLDIDWFKNVNDTYGHNTGDQVLVALAKELNECVRDVDVVGRYGGEELVVVLPETDLAGGILAAERIRQHVEKTPIPTDQGEVPITISMGVAEFHASIPDLASLIDRADSAMYAAKQAGRNRVAGYEK